MKIHTSERRGWRLGVVALAAALSASVLGAVQMPAPPVKVTFTEWATPTPPKGSSQERGNSGVFPMGLYEIQVLDSYQNVTYADGQAAALYGQWPPLANVARKPGEWQTYDIVFEAPRFDGARVVQPAFMTVLWNGVLVHNRKELQGPTQHRRVAPYEPHAAELPLFLQDHGNPVRFRNVWVRRLKAYDQPETR